MLKIAREPRSWLARLAVAALLLLSACSQTPDHSPQTTATNGFVGSSACQDCHTDIYTRWKNTLMANVLQDPQERPASILADFETDSPLVTFGIDDITFTYGSKWKQRYFTRRGDDLFVLPAQWDVQNRNWRRYHPQPGGDWWTDFYPNDPMQRPTGPLCDGCHSVNYDLQTKTPTEWNVGCEACHGAGENHISKPVNGNIINPSRLEPFLATDICIRCHSQGRPTGNPVGGLHYDWPVGYEPGGRLSDTWELEEHHLGEETFSHWPDGSAHKNRMQGNDYVQSQMYVKGVTCSGCHDVHGTDFEADLIAPGNEVCLTCHDPQLQPGPRGSVEAHTRHTADSEGSQCVACHMPAIARTIGDINVRSHTFRFISPTLTDRYGIPNPCASCHQDETDEWVRTALRSWTHLSAWRVTP
jgi:predicted CXXCH cytochrome family protein